MTANSNCSGVIRTSTARIQTILNSTRKHFTRSSGPSPWGCNDRTLRLGRNFQIRSRTVEVSGWHIEPPYYFIYSRLSNNCLALVTYPDELMMKRLWIILPGQTKSNLRNKSVYVPDPAPPPDPRTAAQTVLLKGQFSFLIFWLVMILLSPQKYQIVKCTSIT